MNYYSGICSLCDRLAGFVVNLENGDFVCHNCYAEKCMDYDKTAKNIIDKMIIYKINKKK